MEKISLLKMVGSDVTVEHQTGSGEKQTTSGTLQSLDEQGFILIQDKEGKEKLIPKDKVDSITENGFTNSH